jgi:hypothetical protein
MQRLDVLLDAASEENPIAPGGNSFLLTRVVLGALTVVLVCRAVNAKGEDVSEGYGKRRVTSEDDAHSKQIGASEKVRRRKDELSTPRRKEGVRLTTEGYGETNWK